MDTQNKPLVIGITGPFGSGKSTAASFFEKKGFKKIMLSQFLEEELNTSGMIVTRKNLQDLGNNWRKKSGPQALAIAASEYIKSEKLDKFVVDGIRNLGEINLLKNEFNFILIGIVANRDIRFNRVKELKHREELDKRLFDELDFRDLGITEDLETGLQVAKCLAVSDYFIDSNDGYDEFESDLEKVFKKI